MNVIIFRVDDSSSLLGERDTFGINGSFDAPGNKFSINSGKLKTSFLLSLFCQREKTCKIKPNI